MRKLYYVTQDNGDGSSSVLFFEEHDLDRWKHLVESDPEGYGGNEGTPSFLTVYNGTTWRDLGISEHRMLFLD